MDISFYISELLELRGDINVPGLGYLVQGRISGYYNEAEGKFYPPHNEVQFEPALLDDDTTLTQYIADKKNISLASALYFTEKYVNALKEEALQHDVAIATIGWFYYNESTLAFRPAKKVTNDAAFYGYEPIKATKLGEQPVAESTTVPEPEPVYTPILVPERVEQEVEDEGTLYDEPQTNTLLRGWIIAITLLILLLVTVIAMYKYNPVLFERIKNWRTTKATSTLVAIPPTDTVKADTLITDSTTQLITDTSHTLKNVNTTTTTTTKTVLATPPVSGSVTSPAKSTTVVTTNVPKVGYCAIIIHSSPTVANATAALNSYKAKGVDAHIVNINARPIKISAGRYDSLDEAEVAMTQLISAGKIPDDAYPIEIKR
jgi:hypothetical protein